MGNVLSRGDAMESNMWGASKLYSGSDITSYANPLNGASKRGGGPFFFVGMLKTFFCFIVFLYMSAGCVSTIRT